MSCRTGNTSCSSRCRSEPGIQLFTCFSSFCLHRFSSLRSWQSFLDTSTLCSSSDRKNHIRCRGSVRHRRVGGGRKKESSEALTTRGLRHPPALLLSILQRLFLKGRSISWTELMTYGGTFSQPLSQPSPPPPQE